MKDAEVWTFFVVWDDGTFISQYHAETIEEAIRLYNSNSEIPWQRKTLEERPISVNSVDNVWCVIGENMIDETIICHIVLTDNSGEKSLE